MYDPIEHLEQDAAIRLTPAYQTAYAALWSFRVASGNKYTWDTTTAAGKRYWKRVGKLEDAVAEAFESERLKLEVSA